MLLDVLWAEAAARGDLSQEEAETARRTKALYRSGVRNRRRLRRETLRLGSPWTVVRLDWHLTSAEVDTDAPVARRIASRIKVWLLGWCFTFTPPAFPEYGCWSDA